MYQARSRVGGHGPLWYPRRKQLDWFDILNKKRTIKSAPGALSWSFDDYAWAAGRVAAQLQNVLHDAPKQGKTLACNIQARGETEPQVIL